MAKHLISSNATINAIKKGDPRSRLNDGDGLYLLLFVKGGSHSWRFEYTIPAMYERRQRRRANADATTTGALTKARLR